LDKFKEILLPELKNISTDKLWKTRLALVEFFEKLISESDKDPNLIELITELNESFYSDHVLAIRTQVVENLVMLSKYSKNGE
jgi:hypothetical protein